MFALKHTVQPSLQCHRGVAAPTLVALRPMSLPNVISQSAAARPVAPALVSALAPLNPSRRCGSIVCAAAVEERPAELDLEVQVEELSLCSRRAVVTVPAKGVKEVFKAGVKYIEKEVVGQLRGWQAGKPLPLSMVIHQVGGQDKFKAYCIERLLLDAIQKAVETAAKGRPVDPASIKLVSDAAAMNRAYDPAKAFTFEVAFDVAPPLVWRTPLEELEVTIQDSGDFSTDAAAADDLIRQYRKQHGFSRVVGGRGLQMGDTLVLDMEIRSKATRQALPGLKHSRISFDTESDVLGITQGMLGMKAGETRTFDMALPEDYDVEFWQNMPATATVKVHEMLEWTVPEFDDAYVAAHHDGKWKSAAEMREALIASTAMQRVQRLDGELEDAVVKAVADALDMPEVPAAMVEQLGERQYQAQLLRMLEDRIGSREEVEALATEEMVAEFVEKRRADLVDQVKFNLAVDEIFVSKGLTLAEDAVEGEMQLRAQQMQAVGQPFDRSELLEDVRETVKSVTVVEWLKDNVKRVVLPYNQQPAGTAA